VTNQPRESREIHILHHEEIIPFRLSSNMKKKEKEKASMIFSDMFPKHKLGLMDLCTTENSTNVMMLLTETPMWLPNKSLHQQ
jgi:hypothetical protein